MTLAKIRVPDYRVKLFPPESYASVAGMEFGQQAVPSILLCRMKDKDGPGGFYHIAAEVPNPSLPASA
jgi:hypothetical protein